MVGAKSASEDGKLLYLMLKMKEDIKKEVHWQIICY
jgi:hypothetical protein